MAKVSKNQKSNRGAAQEKRTDVKQKYLVMGYWTPKSQRSLGKR